MIVVASSSTKPCSTSLEAVSRAIAAFLKCAEAAPVEISTAVYGDGDQIVHVPAEGARSLQRGEPVGQALIGNGDTDTCASTQVCMY